MAQKKRSGKNQKQTTSVKQNHETMDCVDVEQIGEYCPGVSDWIFRTGILLYCPELPTCRQNAHTLGERSLHFSFPPYVVYRYGKGKRERRPQLTIYHMQDRPKRKQTRGALVSAIEHGYQEEHQGTCSI
jgi:hypothetical protein